MAAAVPHVFFALASSAVFFVSPLQLGSEIIASRDFRLWTSKWILLTLAENEQQNRIMNQRPSCAAASDKSSFSTSTRALSFTSPTPAMSRSDANVLERSASMLEPALRSCITSLSLFTLVCHSAPLFMFYHACGGGGRKFRPRTRQFLSPCFCVCSRMMAYHGLQWVALGQACVVAYVTACPTLLCSWFHLIMACLTNTKMTCSARRCKHRVAHAPQCFAR